MEMPIGTRQVTWAVRLATEQDAAALAEIYRPYVESSPITFEIDPPNETDMKRRIQETLSSHPWLVAESASSRIVGYAYATTHSVRAAYRWSVDSSVYVDTGFHRRGVGRALYIPLFEILTALGYFNVYAGITLPNSASVALHESFGFRRIGIYRNVGYKLGSWHDVGWWGLALRPPVPNPSPPKALGDTCSNLLAPNQPNA
jgi:L-amino acid N-acyltransferase YncA